MKIVKNAPSSRWREYRDLKLEAVKNVPQSFLAESSDCMRVSEERWQEKMKKVYFAEIEGKLVGMIGVQRNPKPKLNHFITVVGFYVQPEHRSNGAGRELLSQVIEDSKRDNAIKKLQLCVATTQKAGIALYESMGFIEIGIKKYAVKVGDEYLDTKIMELYLD